MIDDENQDLVFKVDAMISHVLHLPFPEQLDDDTWVQKWAQVKWLIDQGIIAPKQPSL